MTGQELLVAVVMIIVWALACLVSPTCRCPRCKGKRAITARRGMRPCPRCKGTGRAYRRGARLVHKTVRDQLGGRIRDRARRLPGRGKGKEE